MSRSVQEISQEYADICGKLGEYVHKMEDEIPKEIQKLKEKINALKDEHAEAYKTQQAEADKLAAQAEQAALVSAEPAKVQ